ncbi:ABC transporter ATP-binding protein [Corynebacterium sp. 320]|uniref:ABC transporter ATP-binding protein n=1 Tax=Corynebacterium TaxID=1716 RepID=UPI00125CC6B2|nr:MULTISPECIES: ABC transporter ATP-binding protein [Corynebacterium]KAB1504537.1 ABC transporter ATP-binding protein [Corynebacterium sp. 320]KAB1553402.1 ABC transporter ATP-binding protein [Corynebacterium sp. 321]KAB1554488.1 ABC transporter ATP-binding protein [Corynebacterium sp. 319]KAB3528673.1 ABC transporter ATP-binding protein [Corynebacterium sp. 250]KAB3540890.1 ABC transporter ATP-binding protein [Corynebacterium sp. 366]
MEPVTDYTNLISAPSTAAAAEEDVVIDMKGVSVVRDGRTILHPMDWQVEVDERWVIIGPNGAGKTTLMKLAAAQMFPTTGTVKLVGAQMGRVDLREIRTSIGMSSSAMAHRIPGDELVEDIVISAGYDVLGRWREEYDDMDREQAYEIMEKVSAIHLVGHKWMTLSEGERKRTLIARALMTDPELLLLDEPGAGLDLGGREDLVALFTDLAQDPYSPAIALITHHVEEIPPGFTHAMLLDEGQVVAQGIIDDVLTSENLTRAFHQPIEIRNDDGRWFARRVRTGGSHRER